MGLGLAVGAAAGGLAALASGTAFAGSNGQQLALIDVSGDPMTVTLTGTNQYGQQTTQSLYTSGGTIYGSNWWWEGPLTIQEFDYDYSSSATVNGIVPVSQSSDWYDINLGTPTNLSLSATANPVFAGQAATFTATATQTVADTPPPTGAVAFEQYDPVAGTSTTLGTAPLIDGTAYFSDSNLGTGMDDVYAAYNGQVNAFNPLYTDLSTQSGVLSETVETEVKTVALSATSLNFGNQVVGSSASQTVTLTNTGNVPWSWTGASSSSSAVGLSGTSTCFTTTVAPGGTCGFSVLYSPAAVGTNSGQLSITDSFGDNLTINVTGTGVKTPSVTSITPKTGPTGGGTKVTVTGQNLVGLTAVSVGSTPAKSFSCSSATTCTLVTPAGTGERNISVTNAAGTSRDVKGDEFTYTG